MSIGPTVHDGDTGDAEALAVLFSRSRSCAMPWLASPHDEPSTRWWVKHVLPTEQDVRVADEGPRLLGFAAVAGDWLEQLYVDPTTRVEVSGQRCSRTPSDGLQLHVFTRNPGRGASTRPRASSS